MSPNPSLVLKVGGSLLDLPDLGHRIETLLRHKSASRVAARESVSGIEDTEASPKVALVAGGGALVNVVRDWFARGLLSETEGHHLGMQLLETTALRLSQLIPRARLCQNPAEARRAWRSGERAIIRLREWFAQSPGWFSGQPILAGGLLPESWSVTSDTLAACVAIDLDAESLLLAKSIPEPAATAWDARAQCGAVDVCFPQVAARLSRIAWYDLRSSNGSPPVEGVELIGPLQADQ